MSLPTPESERILELERILAHDRRSLPARGESQTDPAALHLTEMPTERIRRFTHALGTTSDSLDNDTIDFLTIRLLLNDFTSAVGHLRAVANIATSLIDKAAAAIREAQDLMKVEAGRDEKMRAQGLSDSGSS